MEASHSMIPSLGSSESSLSFATPYQLLPPGMNYIIAAFKGSLSHQEKKKALHDPFAMNKGGVNFIDAVFPLKSSSSYPSGFS